ncbi:MAG: ClpXP protease specificity-enhancing factor [Burkholderiaceae bacterium]|nr:ClpXP protease specificity-enhancing factor [Burkholderiaceae bacterium]
MNPNLSQTPYLIRALWQWCTDAGLSPQLLVSVDEMTQVPRQFVVDKRIVLDISAEATNRLELGDEWITFQARFGEKVENLSIPVGNVMAIYAEETNQGMAFDVSPMQGNIDDNVDDDIKGVEVEFEQTLEKPNKASPLKVVK